MSDTIVALASGGVIKSAVAVVRISGSRVRFALETMCGDVPQARKMCLRYLKSSDGEILDQALVVFFPAPFSFTGEDCAELHVHGSRAVIQGIIAYVLTLDGVRLAQAGEFTQRAFHNNKLDLAQVEGLADVIDAETNAQKRQALKQLEGALGKKALTWRHLLISALAQFEAHIDFSDEGDVPASLYASITQNIDRLIAELEKHLHARAYGQKVREGFVVALLGPPNSGKSSLINALSQKDVSIVSPFPGTTRDTIEVQCDVHGLPVIFIDTAGLRETSDPIEQIGIERARIKAKNADLQIWLSPVDAAVITPDELDSDTLLTINSKSDMLKKGDQLKSHEIYISSHHPDTIDSLSKLIHHRFSQFELAESGVIIRERHYIACQECVVALKRCLLHLPFQHDELAAEDLRLAIRALSSLIGVVDVDAVLDQLFSSFCIGK